MCSNVFHTINHGLPVNLKDSIIINKNKERLTKNNE